ncbi:MAG: NAD(P)H-dependent oxidoreductase [Bacteroidales bacterium]|nr:NAD(P)H-dependent oxidoreductase [Bacteroidales bacterium]
MKRILIICGSPRKNGNSDLLAARLASGAVEAGHTVETVYIRDLRMGFCHGCLACLPDRKACVQRDDINALLPRVLEADVLVLCTPVYYYSVTGQMKTFLDRLNPLYGHLRGKDVVYMVTAMDDSHAQLDRAMDAMQGFVDCFDDMRVRARVYGGGATEKGEVVGTQAYDEAYLVGKTL